MTSPAAPPSDLELMMFHDGELDEARHREVEAYLQGEGAKTGTGKLAGLSFLSSLVVESQVPVARSQEKQADAIAALVMAQVAETSRDETRASRAPKLDRAVVEDAAPANDNGRFIMVLAGLAAAAAAALFVWGRSAPVEAPSAAVENTQEAPAEAPLPVETVAAVQPSPSATTSATSPTVEEAETEPSVEVASVDFGAASGAVYYVPSDSAGQTTAVVWLKDE